jgi:3-keto steroid reductase
MFDKYQCSPCWCFLAVHQSLGLLPGAFNGTLLSFLIVNVVVSRQARLFGSPHHTIKPFNAAIAAIHISLIPLFLIPTKFSKFSPDGAGDSPTTDDNKMGDTRPVRFGSETGRWGDARVGVTEVKEWEAHREEAACLVEKCEHLYQDFVESEGVR